MTLFARTKVQLPRPRLHVDRPALQAVLSQALLERRCVLLCAAAGYGKTSALAWQLAQLPPQVARAWVACDEADTPLQLFHALLAALEPHDLPWRLSPEALAIRAAQAGSVQARRALAAELINALDAAEVPHGVIAIDDLHRVDAPEVAEFLGFLLERGSPRWTVAIGTRTEPALPLARWRADGSLFELREADLRFDADEARALAGDRADAPTLAHLLDRTQGWPAGLGLALGSGGRTPGATLPATERSWFELLTSEVIDKLPPSLREFLLLTSVLPELTPARAAAVSGMADAASLLDQVAQHGPFVTLLDGSETTLRLHDLFREALSRRLRLERPAERDRLLRRAAAGERDPVRQVGYLIEAGDLEGGEASLLESAGELITTGATAAVQRLLERFPPQAQGLPGLEFVRGLLAWERWDWQEMPRAMRSASQGWQLAGDARRERQCLPYLALALSGAGRQQAMAEALAPLRAPEVAATLDPATRCRMLLCDIWQAQHDDEVGRIAPLLEQQVELLRTLPPLQIWFENIPIPPLTGLPGTRAPIERYVAEVLHRTRDEATLLRGSALVLGAWLDFQGGDWASAESRLAAVADIVRWLSDPPSLQMQWWLAQAQALQLRGRPQALRAFLQRGLDAAAAPAARRRQPRALAVIVQLGLRLATQAEDRQLHAELMPYRASLLPADERWLGERALVLMRACDAQLTGNNDEALALRLQLLQGGSWGGPQGGRAALVLGVADGLLRQRRRDEAAALLATLCRELQGAGESGSLGLAGLPLLQRVVERSAGMLPAAEHALLSTWADRTRDWQDHATDAAPAPEPDGGAEGASAGAAPPDSTSLAGEPLSMREAEVLRLIADGQPNKLIARALDISPHTVKRHVANILDKLGLSSRGQAAAWWHAQGG